ncbi:hypothetical protein, partial [Streptomyces sp.]|uniref:hypothetical protein n=1 Tax=Streptomyces sp. TaxID=1931 RepID=UPI0028121D63
MAEDSGRAEERLPRPVAARRREVRGAVQEGETGLGQGLGPVASGAGRANAVLQAGAGKERGEVTDGFRPGGGEPGR